MRIVIDAVGIRGHGGAAVLCELLHWLPKVRPDWNWHVFLFDRDLREFNDPPVERNVSFEYTRDGNSGFARLLWVDLQLQKRLREIKPDVVFSFANIGPIKPSIPQIVFVQQTNAFFNEGIPKREFLRRLRFSFMRWQILKGARASRAVIVQTGAMRKRMLIYVPELHGRIYVIPSGFRTPSLNPVIRPEKKTLIDSAGHPRLIYVSYPSEHKNHISLIKALPDVAEHFNSVSLLLTLEYDPPNQRYASFVKEIVRTSIGLGMGEQLIWLGILTPDEVSYALSNSDLMVFPSIAESFGLGLVEAIAAGCPIAASDLPYAHDVAGDAAVYFDPLSPKNIAQTIAATLSERDTIERMKAAGAPLKERYSYENIAHQIAEVLTSATLD